MALVGNRLRRNDQRYAKISKTQRTADKTVVFVYTRGMDKKKIKDEKQIEQDKKYDPMGSYTGRFALGDDETPEQDADDL